MPVRPCIGCNRLFSQLAHSRCPECLRVYERQRPPRKRTSARGYGADWQKVSTEAREAQPWCSVDGCRNRDLTVDHVIPISLGGTLEGGVVVLCRSHNSARQAKPLAAFLAEAAKDLRR